MGNFKDRPRDFSAHLPTLNVFKTSNAHKLDGNGELRTENNELSCQLIALATHGDDQTRRLGVVA